MADRQFLPSLFPRLLKRTGGFYLLIVVMIIQAITNLLIAPAVLLVQSNANLSSSNLSTSIWATLIFTALSNLIVLGITYLINRNAFGRLEVWKRYNSLPALEAQEKNAWHEITRLPWRYGLVALASSFLVVVFPLIAYQDRILHLANDQLIYTLMGGIVAALIIVSAGTIGIEWLLQPAREILLPTSFEAQVKDVVGFNIFWKLQVFIIAMVATGIITLAPLGYRKIVQVVEGMEPIRALREYQLQSLLITFVILVIAAVMTTLIANLFSTPFRQLVDTFKKVEQGQLNQRARVIATDEAGELEIYFNQMITRLEDFQSSLEKLVDERTAQLAAVVEVGHSASAILDPDELIEKVVNLITDRFGHYYAAIFLLDSSGQWAELRSATGEAGRVLRESHHRLVVDNKSMVGSAISQKEARIALDVGQEPVRFNNPLLAYTRSEIALPLIVGDSILGALDVQSMTEAAFQPEDIETLQNMANQVAVALEHARLFQETNQRLTELQNAQRQYVHESWTALASNEHLEYGVGDAPSSETEPSIQVPLALRDEIIGQISMTGEDEWSPEDRAWVASVATQAAIALENARLMEESRKQAGTERTVAEITTKVWSAETIDGILQTAVREIGQALNLSEASIELNIEGQEEIDHE